MGTATRHYLLDVILALLAVLLALSSTLLWVILPRGYSPARRLWVDIHKWGGLALGIAVLLHVVLHWAWLVRMTRRYAGHLRDGVYRVAKRPTDLAQRGRPSAQ